LKKYECLYIVNVNYDSEGISAVTARIEEILKNSGAELKNTQHWGKRKLAYAIDKERYGNYVLLHFEGEDPSIADFQREIEIELSVLHYMTIRLDEFPDFEALTIPQAVENDRKRPGMGGREGGYDRDRPRRDDRDRPRRDDDRAPVAPAAPVAEETAPATEEAAPAVEETEAVSEKVVETPVEVAAAPEPKVEEVVEAPVEAAPVEEAPAEEAEKPAEAAE